MSRATEHPGEKPAGRVLRVKWGYNPNSSSIGSGIPAFLAFAAGAGGFTVILLSMLHAAGRLIRARHAAESPPANVPE